MKKTIGIIMLSVLGLTVLGGMAGAGDGFYTVMGLGFFVAGIWGGILLIKSK